MYLKGFIKKKKIKIKLIYNIVNHLVEKKIKIKLQKINVYIDNIEL